jgi:colanic acid biosynthesis glycosyl transferase WcaI
LRILVHDYGGYSFTRQLARQLARRGHQVHYLHGMFTQQVKRASPEQLPEDPRHFEISGVVLSKPYNKYSLIRRWFQDVEYGRRLVETYHHFRPEVVLSANTPLDAQWRLMNASLEDGAVFIHWMQDLIGIATYTILKQKSKLLANSIGKYYLELEKQTAKRSHDVVVIADDFLPVVSQWRQKSSASVHVIPNWAPLDDLPVHSKINAWSQQHDLDGSFNFIYTGVLGFKHNPEIFIRAARHFSDQAGVKFVVISSGQGAAMLQQQKEALGLSNLLIFDFISHDLLPFALAAADVLVVILGKDAGIYSVPSKVLTYLCSQRPLLASIEPENHAARLIVNEEAGLVARPGNLAEFISYAQQLFEQPKMRMSMARRARRYAESNFDIHQITDQFEKILTKRYPA